MNTPTTVAEIKTRQRFLKSQGFDPGPIDGKWGRWSIQAEKAFDERMMDTAAVRRLQLFLNERNAKLEVDGVYGPATRAAEYEFDKAYPGHPDHTGPNLAIDGWKPILPTDLQGDARTKIIQVAKSIVGIREKTGKNDGVAIDKILASCGLEGTRNPYCACTIVYCGDMALGKEHNPYPRSAWSPDLVAKPTWQQGIGGRNPRPGDAFGIYFASKGRVAHCGLILEWASGEPFCLTIEGNTGERGAVTSPGAREGDGIYMKRRMKSDIYSVRDWIGVA